MPLSRQQEATMLNLDALESAPLVAQPFDHCIVSGFLTPTDAQAVLQDFPAVAKGGSFPLSSLRCGPALSGLAEQLQGPQVAVVLGRKFGLELSKHPTLMTLRARSRAKDGRIHRDSDDKLLTALLYLNDDWSDDSGRLRLLRGPADIEDYAVEVTPQAGTLLVFRCTDRSWHGHKPYEGVRQVLQINWVTDATVVRREQWRHGFSAGIKTLFSKVRPT